VSVHQDGKLAVMKDNYGNTPFTLDATFKVIYESPQKYIGDIPITITTSIKYEQANIIGTYRRYAGEVGINFNEINIFPFEIEINPTFNYGYITRYDISGGSFEFGGEIIIPITENFKVSVLNTYTQRTDIYKLWRIKQMRYNLGFGFRYGFNLK
jgi:hypothetical protein